MRARLIFCAALLVAASLGCDSDDPSSPPTDTHLGDQAADQGGDDGNVDDTGAGDTGVTPGDTTPTDTGGGDTATGDSTSGDTTASDTANQDTGGDSGTGDPVVLFHSDWRSGLGEADDAVLDATQALPWDVVGGRGRVSVVDATGLDFPSPHVLQVDGAYNGPGVQPIETRQVAVLPTADHWPIPQVGESLYFRLYKRLVYPARYEDLGNNNHPIEEQAGGASNWSWAFHTSADGWRPRFQSLGTPAYFMLGPSSAPVWLERDKTYRLEWRLQRTGESTFSVQIRIYDGSGALLFDDADFHSIVGGGGTLADNPSLTLQNASTLDGLQLGTNGPSADPGEDVVPMWYIGAVCVRADDWCGAYADGI